MRAYEYRFIGSEGKTSLIVHEMQLSDAAAIRSARKMAKGQIFEVWSELDRIYTSQVGNLSVPNLSGPRTHP